MNLMEPMMKILECFAKNQFHQKEWKQKKQKGDIIRKKGGKLSKEVNNII